MQNHSFELTFELPGSADIDAVVESLAENCSDSIVGIGAPGIVALAFDREAEDLQRAVTRAIEDVRNAVPGATLAEFVVGQGNTRGSGPRFL